MSTSASISRSTHGKNEAASSSSKIVYIVRHGQAVHNVRAEKSRQAGCSFAEFLQLMKDDDALDAPLTPLGIAQAQHCRDKYFRTTTKTPTQDGAPTKNHNTATTNPLGIDLIVASCLSRTIDTADILFPPSFPPAPPGNSVSPPRLCLEQFREINGALLNGKRRTKAELREQYQAPSPHNGPSSSGGWNFDSLRTETDESWDPDALEPTQQSAERGYQGLMDLLVRSTTTNTDDNSSTSLDTILLVGHGGMLKYTMTDHPCVQLRDERTTSTTRSTRKSVAARFDNCELRKYRLSWRQQDEEEEDNNNRATEEDDTHDDTTSSTPRVPPQRRRGIVLTQLDH